MGTRTPHPTPDRADGEAPEAPDRSEAREAPATSRTVLSHISSL